MNISDRTLSRRYAQAFYDGARDAAEGERAVAELAEARARLMPKMGAFRHPRVSPADKKSLLKRELPGASERTRRFLELLIDKKRFGLLPLIAADAARISDDRRGVAHASVRAAQALTDDQRRALEKALGAYSGKKVAVDVRTDPALLAGVVVRMGDWVFDASLKGQLKRLKERLAA